ncbi:MAG: methyl-accepting chemotaxis protein [Lachnospiraceae bacterium]|nr:methyl-accepting chemotaxis protein [Lachnospiraceae bacterium]
MKKKISIQLMAILLPIIAIFIAFLGIIIFSRAKTVIVSNAHSALRNDSKANAGDIAADMESIMGYYDGAADILSNTEYTSDAEFLEAAAILMEKFEETELGAYFGMSNKQYLDPSGWVPEAGYDPTERDWYVDGIDKAEMTPGEAYLDLESGSMIVSLSRKITLWDGRTGVMATDVVLGEISEKVATYKPGGTGHAVLFDGEMILASADTAYNGTYAGDYPEDKFINSLAECVSLNSDSILAIKDNQGKLYYVSCAPVGKTGWTLASYVPEEDVLIMLYQLETVTIILVAAILAILTAVIIVIVRKLITKPVSGLTDTIIKISEGDFTVDIRDSGTNEIGVMNGKMREYVQRMRETLTEMSAVTDNLKEEAANTRSASATMSEQAENQSQSMEQIHDSMEGVAYSVTELATNATELASAVSEVTEDGDAANIIMANLLDKAKEGQKDMNNVQVNMDNISVSMKEMSDVVEVVDESAKKISSIVEMISAISSQTNLLSLNASIEAARAGEAGKGFAVVATEIGNLANESAKATTEIAEIIEDITTEIDNLSSRSKASVVKIAESNDAVLATKDTFAEIFTSLDEAGDAVGGMISKMAKVNDIATNVAAIAEEQSASTEEVSATVESAASSAMDVAAESRNVDESAVTVSESAEKIGEFVKSFKI